MMESILTSVKKLLGISEDEVSFDADIIMHINATLSILTQLGVGPATGFSISDKSALWKDFLGSDPRLSLVKSYVYMKVRLLFDPPTSSGVLDSMQKSVNEFEWRANVQVDPGDSE